MATAVTPTCSTHNAMPPSEHMLWVPGGTFLMGSNHHYPEERPVHRVAVDGFWMDRYPVTNRQFRRFIDATGYVTVAERRPDPGEYPDVDPTLLVAGSLVFRRPVRPVNLSDHRAWWAYVPGACWMRPEGLGSTLAGNVWEWTSDFFSPRHPDEPAKACCVPRNPRVTFEAGSYPAGERVPRRVVKGGSHLCAPNYCLRYRPAARQGEAVDTSACHLGFRCVLRPQDARGT